MTSNKYAELELILHTATLVHIMYWKVSGHACNCIFFFFFKKPIRLPTDGFALLSKATHSTPGPANSVKPTELRGGDI